MISLLLALWATAPAFCDESPAVNPRRAAVIEHIVDGTNVEVTRGDSTLMLKRGDELLSGDSLATGKQTVYLLLNRLNELQITPRAKITFEEASPDTENERNVIVLQEGLVWGLVANGFSLASPLYMRTQEMSVAIPGANFVMEHLPSKRATSIIVLEGAARYARDLNEISSTKKSYFITAGLRVHTSDGKLSTTKPYRRPALIAYLNKTAKATAKDMATRGSRVLASISKKERKSATDDAITWLVPAGVAGTTPSNGMGTGPSMDPNQSNPGMGTSMPPTGQ